jgi:hypothetical protein
VWVYVNELADYFDQVVIVHNTRPLENIKESLKQNISMADFPNEGYDFGLFYRYFKTIKPENFSQIACVNDSNILINKLEQVINWGMQADYDFWGIMDSNERPWFSSHDNNYHIQSHFLVFKRRAIEILANFINTIDAEKIFAEKDQKKLRRLVINQWEIGLSRYLFEANLCGGAFICSEKFRKQYNIDKPVNIGHKLYPELIQSGLPLLKKRIIMSPSYKDRFRFRKHWKKLFLKHGNPNWNIRKIIQEMEQIRAQSSNSIFYVLKMKIKQGISVFQDQKAA